MSLISENKYKVQLPPRHADGTESLISSVLTLSVRAAHSVQGCPDLDFRDVAKGRKLFPRQNVLFKGLVNVLWLFHFTTTRSGLQEIISKLGQKIQLDSWVRILAQICKEDFALFVC